RLLTISEKLTEIWAINGFVMRNVKMSCPYLVHYFLENLGKVRKNCLLQVAPNGFVMQNFETCEKLQ
ncbi:MAG: hypothetical protein NC299_14765, partial [Lachnospiraceae bacterium]|nr:hypothetical protein [Ruminococcus sp.]MCM1276599.1 hypothetical protein [Lachnospiraceae bacterium]